MKDLLKYTFSRYLDPNSIYNGDRSRRERGRRDCAPGTIRSLILQAGHRSLCKLEPLEWNSSFLRYQEAGMVCQSDQQEPTGTAGPECGYE